MPSSDPILLAIETSQRQGGIAVRDRAGRAHVERLAVARRHDDDLLGAINRLFGRLELEPWDLGPLFFSLWDQDARLQPHVHLPLQSGQALHGSGNFFRRDLIQCQISRIIDVGKIVK